MTDQDFNTIVGQVIDQLEGGYYHPDMLKDGRVKDARYGSSGETMFGIDRLNGGSLNTSPAGIEFWNLIDTAKASQTWKWNYKGGDLAPKLKTLVGEMMKPTYETLSKTYLSSEAKQLVDSDKRLTFNFVYAVWNGAGWFKGFATKVNAAVASGTTDLNKLYDIVIQARTTSTNSLMSQGGKKIEEFLKSSFFFVKRNWKYLAVSGLLLGVAITGIVIIVKNNKK